MEQMQIDFTTASPINKDKLSGQNGKIYNALQCGTVTVLKAIGMGVYHLHSRISDLRNKHKIYIYDRTIVVKDIEGNVVVCKEYSLQPFENKAA